VPWQLFGHGRSDRSTKLTRGLISETPAGFRSRRGPSYEDSAPVTPHNAPFPTYKTPRLHRARGRGGGVAARGAGATAGDAISLGFSRVARRSRSRSPAIGPGSRGTSRSKALSLPRARSWPTSPEHGGGRSRAAARRPVRARAVIDDAPGKPHAPLHVLGELGHCNVVASADVHVRVVQITSANWC
jgi:hypothetical protein